MNDERMISTLPYVTGKRVNKELGIVVAFDDQFQLVRSPFNIEESLNRAYDRLYEKALKLGANAVLGVNFACSSQSMVPIVQGTAVVLEDDC